MTTVFEFRTNDANDGYVFARVEADNEREARAYVKDQIFARKLSSREVIEAAQNGRAIVNAKTGEVIGALTGDSAEASSGAE